MTEADEAIKRFEDRIARRKPEAQAEEREREEQRQEELRQSYLNRTGRKGLTP